MKISEYPLGQNVGNYSETGSTFNIFLFYVLTSILGECNISILVWSDVYFILNVNEKLPASKFQYFGKYKIELFGYCYVYVSGQRQTGLER